MDEMTYSRWSSRVAAARLRALALTACAVLALASCATSTDASSIPASATESQLVEESPVAEEQRISAEAALPFGDDFRFESGITVSVAQPKSFMPSETAYPQAARAVAFEISIYNGSNRPYRLSNLGVTATVASTPAKQVMDATQGFNGIVDADRDIPPQRNVRLTLAFAVPAEPSPLSLELRPNRAAEATATYRGSA
jgi:hypothetical protein